VRRRIIISALTAVVAVIVGIGVAVAAGQGTGARNHRGSGATAGVPRICPHKGRYEPVDPRRALPLPGNAIAPSVNDAIREAQHGNRSVRHERLSARAISAAFALPWTGAPKKHNSVVLYCGTRIALRTVVVNLFFPRALPSASLSYSQVWVSRFAHNRYRVWFIFH
jgi:hypothetical protein